MLTNKTDVQLIEKLDDRLRSVMMKPTQSGDRAALVYILRHINAERVDRREKVWQHYEKTISHGLNDTVREMHRVYDVIQLELNNRPAAKAYDDVMAKVAEARRSEALTVDQ